MKQVLINVYSFDELSDKAKQKAIYEHGIFLDSQPEEFETEIGELAWEYVEHTEDEIVESIQINEYMFFADGTLANCVTYTGKHPKAGTTELNFKGEIFTL